MPSALGKTGADRDDLVELFHIAQRQMSSSDLFHLNRPKLPMLTLINLPQATKGFLIIVHHHLWHSFLNPHRFTLYSKLCLRSPRDCTLNHDTKSARNATLPVQSRNIEIYYFQRFMLKERVLYGGRELF